MNCNINAKRAAPSSGAIIASHSGVLGESRRRTRGKPKCDNHPKLHPFRRLPGGARGDASLCRIFRAPEAAPHCDASLWQHVYAGEQRRFDAPKDRLHVIRNCVEVTGTIVNARAERNGDLYLRLKLDRPYRNMLKDKNMSEQHGDLVLEPMCSNPGHRRDTIK